MLKVVLSVIVNQVLLILKAFRDLHNPPEIQRPREQEGSFSSFPELEYVHPDQRCKGHARIGSSSEVDALLGHAQVCHLLCVATLNMFGTTWVCLSTFSTWNF